MLLARPASSPLQAPCQAEIHGDNLRLGHSAERHFKFAQAGIVTVDGRCLPGSSGSQCVGRLSNTGVKSLASESGF